MCLPIDTHLKHNPPCFTARQGLGRLDVTELLISQEAVRCWRSISIVKHRKLQPPLGRGNLDKIDWQAKLAVY